MTRSAAVIQAAGKGSRFHADEYKLLSKIEGEPMIIRTLRPVLEAGFDEIIVVIGCHAAEMRAALRKFPVRIIENPDWERGQSTSLSAGLRAVADSSDRACLLLGDQPFLKVQTLRDLLAVSKVNPDDVIVPFYEGKRGNPIVVPAYRYPLLLELTKGDMGGKRLLETVGYEPLHTDDPGVLRDIDTVEDIVNDTNFWQIKDGIAVPLYHNTKTIAETSAFTPLGAYTTFRTFGCYDVLRMTKHFDRLEETSRLAGHEIHLDRAQLKSILADLISRDKPEEKRIRITIDLEKEIGTIYIAMEPLSVPAPQLYADGIVCVTTEAHRDNPKAKLSNFLEKAQTIRGRENEKFDEILMRTPEGDLLEGLSSNFYGVIGGTVYTAEAGVLSGTTRDYILRIAQELEIPVCLRPLNISELDSLDEAFISSTSRSILPIRVIDGVEMKAKVPGPVTGRLMQRFFLGIQTGLESLKE